MAVLVCFVFKPMHLESVSDLTIEASISTLRRCVVRRGKPLNNCSDNGTNLVGAVTELQELEYMKWNIRNVF